MTSRPGGQQQRSASEDLALWRGIRRGNDAALRQLMGRYDRLVRFHVYRLGRSRCLSDPEWLDAVASAAWMGFVRAATRPDATPPKSVSAFLVQVARNQCITALRAAIRTAGDPVPEDIPDPSAPADDAAAQIEELAALRECLAELPEQDRLMVAQLSAIADRRWSEAAAALGWSESTLRSRWRAGLERLRACLRKRIGREFAPGGLPDD